MPAVAVSVADAVVKQIESATLSQQVTPRRSYADWELDLSKSDLLEHREADKLHVDVVAQMTEQRVELAARGGRLKYIIPVDIGVRRKFGADKQNDDTGRIDIAEVDALMLLVQELYELFMPQRLTEFPFAVWDGENGGTRILAAPVRDHLRKMRQFTGLIRVVFISYRDT
jgi:hypothetical protein